MCFLLATMSTFPWCPLVRSLSGASIFSRDSLILGPSKINCFFSLPLCMEISILVGSFLSVVLIVSERTVEEGRRQHREDNSTHCPRARNRDRWPSRFGINSLKLRVW